MVGEPPSSPARACIASLLALALAMGVGRFAFTPLLPLMVRDGLLRGSEGAWLATANYLGYLAGALWLTFIAFPPVRMMRWSSVAIVAVTALMGVSGRFYLWILWRFVAGVLSACALVATSAWSLEQLARAKRPRLAGIVYVGVGLGIAVVGGFCLLISITGVSASKIWIRLSFLAALLAGLVLWLLPRSSSGDTTPRSNNEPANFAAGSTTLVFCYGLYGFGYVIPATFLPAIARTLIDNPVEFGLAWPLFGLAAMIFTLLAATALTKTNRLTLWCACGVAMGTGTVLPAIWPSLTGILLAALLVGGTFVVATMAGLQEARARAPGSPAKLLGRMTSAFALGQVLGPAFAATLTYFRVPSAMNRSLEVSALVLFGSVAILWFERRRRLEQPRPPPLQLRERPPDDSGYR